MSSEPLRLGFIGGALDSAVGTTHKIASQMDGRWALAAGCFSTNADMNRLTGRTWGLPPESVYPDYRSLLESEHGRLDAVVVLTPTPSHTAIVVDALSRGYPVICEKALATSSREAAGIREAVEKRRGFLAVTYNYTGYPMAREMRSIIRSDALGKLQQIHVEMPQEGFLRLGRNDQKPTPQAWRLRDLEIPTLYLDLGVHLVHMVGFLSGERPVELVAANSTFGFFADIVDNTMCLARYSGGLDCRMWFSKSALGETNGLRVRICGEKGAIEWYQLRPETLLLHDKYGRKSTLERSSVDLALANDARYNRFKAGHPAGFLEAFANHYFDLADGLAEFKSRGRVTSPWVFGIDEAQEGLLVLEAMARSAKSKAWQTIEGSATPSAARAA